MRADQIGQIATDFSAERKFSVAERAGAGKSGRNVAAGLTLYAFFGDAFGTRTIFERSTLFKDSDLSGKALINKLISGKNTRRSGADNDYVLLHVLLPP